MADLIPVAASVLPATSGQLFSGKPPLAGETLTRGMALYQKASDSKIYKAKNNVGSPFPEAVFVGICLADVAINQPVVALASGGIVLGCAVAPGLLYGVSANFGGICPITDLGAGKATTVIGYGLADATTLFVSPLVTGVSQ